MLGIAMLLMLGIVFLIILQRKKRRIRNGEFHSYTKSSLLQKSISVFNYLMCYMTISGAEKPQETCNEMKLHINEVYEYRKHPQLKHNPSYEYCHPSQ